jgi:hypothetical protein
MNEWTNEYIIGWHHKLHFALPEFESLVLLKQPTYITAIVCTKFVHYAQELNV